MNVITYNLNDVKNGGKVTDFNYSRSLNELVSSWSAQVAGGTFKAGNSISFDDVMTNGIISKAYKDNTGLWHISGKDAGVKLMRTTPDINNLPKGSARTVITYLANYCDINLSMSGEGLTGFNVRSIISGSTCAEAILELAMVSGYVAFIGNNGSLNVVNPTKTAPNFSSIINDTGSDIDLDGYATQVLVNLTRRKWQDQNEGEGAEYVHYSGETPSSNPTRVSYNGSFSNGNYSLTMLEPFGVIARAETTITENNVTITTIEDHDYYHKSKTIWRENQEYMLFAFVERGYTLTKITQGTYNNLAFKETTTETMTRTLAMYDADGVPEDWADDIEMVQSESISRSTIREGGKEVTENMPAYSPPFDTQIERTYRRENFGRGLTCNEVETTYEARQVGTINPIKIDGELVPHFLLNTNLAIQTHSTPQWVPVKTYRTYYEQYDAEGNCVVSTRSEYSDDGAEWLTKNALSDTGFSDLNEYQEAYAKFSQHSQGLEVSLGNSIISSPWHFIEVPGRVKTTSNEQEGLMLGNISDWYDNGVFSVDHCPFYNTSTGKCNIYNILNMYNLSERCLYSPSSVRQSCWQKCERSKKALALAMEEDTAQVEAPIIGMASAKGSTKVGYQRDIYVDEIISDTQAQTIADTIAANILKIKSNKGIRKSVTIPYSPNYNPNGTIIEVAHDWQNLQTSITYLESGDIPDFLISSSVASIAAFVSTRENARQNIPQYGVVVSFTGGYVVVKIGNKNVSCTTKLKNLAENDIVLVAFASGNKLRGQVIARL